MTGALADSAERVASLLRAFFVVERTAASEGFLQARDPRAKLVSITALVVAAMLTRSVAVLVAMGAIVVGLALLSSVPLRTLLARSTFVPAATLLVVAPQAVLQPGETVVAALGLRVTGAGVAYVLLFTLRVGVSVALLSLLVLTTPFSSVVAAMRGLGVPTPLVWVVAVTYRYLFLFFDELRRLLLARNSRTTGGDGLRAEWRDARRLAGTFLLRSLERGERVGRGMRARGGARPPAPYRRSRSLDHGDVALGGLAAVAVATSVVIRWGL
ncbi:MAG: cobalt ECF transporter T component CbiQ [Haloferacaceae archaeon]